MKLRTGYLPKAENRKWLREKSAPFPYAASEAAKAPEEIDHRPWINIEQQGQTNSCVGHGDSTALEICNFYDTGGEIVSLSRWYAYITAQKESGHFGKDQGSTISGAVAANRKYGICLEKTYPFTGAYVTRIPQAAHDEASKHKLLRHSVMGSYQDCLAWFQTGQGPVVIGVRWVAALSETSGVVESLRGRSSPFFHCVCLTGYSTRKDRQGRKYLWLVNSHGRGWGAEGWAEIAPAVVDQWCKYQDGEEVIGVSDLEEYGARKVTTWRGVTG